MPNARPFVILFDTVCSGLRASRRAALLQKDASDILMPRNKLREVKNMLNGYKTLCSVQSSHALGTALMELRKSHTDYREALFICTSWCKETSMILLVYMEYHRKIASDVVWSEVKDLLLQILTNTFEALSQVLGMYESSSLAMGVAEEHILSLSTMLDSEFRPGSVYYDDQRKRIVEGLHSFAAFAVTGIGSLFAAIGGLWKGRMGYAAGGGCGLVISAISASFAIRARTKSRMEMERRDVQDVFDGMRRDVEAAKIVTDAVRSEMVKEVTLISGALNCVEDIAVEDTIGDDAANALTALLSELKQVCDARVEHHEKLKAFFEEQLAC